MNKIFIFLLLLVSLEGCSSYMEEPKSAEDVLKDDPAFSVVLEKKKASDGKISAEEARFAKEKEALSARIRESQDELRIKKQESDGTVRSIKNELSPERTAIKENMRAVKLALSEKQNAVKNIDKMLLDVSKLIEKSGELKMSASDRSRWDERSASLLQQKDVLAKDISALKEKLRLLRSEERLLKQ